MIIEVTPPKQRAFPQLRPIGHWRDLLTELVWRDLKIQYKRSVLGILWSLVNPLVQLMVFVFVFRTLLKLGVPGRAPYASFVFVGVLVWNWFQSSVQQATTAVTASPELIRRPGFPALILPVVTVTKNLIHFLLALPILLGFLLVSGIPFAPVLLLLPAVVLVQYLLTLSLSYFVAALNVLFRDTQHIVGVTLLVAFYATPIFYSPKQVPEEFRNLYYLNPMVHVIDAYRAILLDGQMPDWLGLSAVGIAACLLVVAGYSLFRRMSDRFLDEL